MGTVYLAEDTNLKRRVALKFLSPGTVHDPDAAARLLREARAASALDHPHIATIYEIGTHAGQPFIAMAHYEGETLAARLTQGQLTLSEVARILEQVADALAAAHAAGIVHRDLKPSNLMVTPTLNGRFDYFFPTATSQEPLFNLLGTPAEHKRRVVYPSAHIIPRNETIKEVVNWMEKYWGEPRH
jgi:serine/threonine protein kinase